MYLRLAELILRYRGAILVGFAVVAAVCFSRLPQLGFDFTPQQLFKSRSGLLDERERFAEVFGREDNLIFVVLKTKDAFQPEVIQYARDITVEARKFEFLKAADSLATMELPRPGDQPGVLSTESVIPKEGAVSAEDAQKLRSVAEKEPIVRGQVVSEDGTTTVVLMWLNDDIQDVTVIRDAVEQINALLAARPPPNGTTTVVAGIPHLRQEIVESLKYQQMTFVPATGLAYLLILLVLFRRFSGVLLPLGVVAITCSLVVALMVLTGSSINIINNILPSLIFIIGVSDSIHMLVRDAEEIEDGADRMDAIRQMVSHTGVACLLTSTTTAVGFLSLLAAETDILKNFGWQAGTAVLAAYAVTLFFLPAALSFMRPVKRKSPEPDAPEPFLERTLLRFGEHVLDHAKAYVLVCFMVASAAAWAGSSVVIDTILLEVYEPGHPTYENIVLLEEKLGGVLPVEISLRSEERDAFKDPGLFAKIHAIQTFAGKDPVARSTQSLVTYHQAARAALLGDPKQREVMPDSREQVEQLHLLIAGSPDSKLGPNRFITNDFREARVLVRVADEGARQQKRLGRELNAKLAELFPPESGITYSLTGDAYVASLSLSSFITDLFFSLLLAVVIIFAMMIFVFRSFKLGLISVVPNMIPLVMTFGYMGLMNIDLNTTTIITFSISLGLAVDDTIHFLARFQEELRHHPARQAVLNAYNGAGRAIMLTSVMLLVGLVVLLFSDFVPTRMFGTLTGITIFGAIFGDLVLLPPLLYLFFREPESEAETSA